MEVLAKIKEVDETAEEKLVREYNRLNVCASLPTPPPKSCIEALTSNIIVLGVGPLGGS